MSNDAVSYIASHAGLDFLHFMDHDMKKSVWRFGHRKDVRCLSEVIPFSMYGVNVTHVGRQEGRERWKREFLGPKDPLFMKQWHLHNITQANVHINVMPAWEMGFTGKGVVIGVVDDGVQSNHPDLSRNFRRDLSWNFNYFNDNVDPRDSLDWHGTSSAGCASASADGEVCGVGVAYNAEIASIVLLQKTELTDATEAQALQFKHDEIHIYSNSWGPPDDTISLDKPGNLLKEVIQYSVENGRNGLGSIYVWAVGNGGMTGDNCNYDGYANSRYSITVGSVDFSGERAPFSEECSALFAVTPSSSFLQKKIVTTGYTDSSDDTAKCTESFSGTSVSCATMSGVIALVLEANNQLTWLDVQYVIKDSSSKTGNGDWHLNGGSNWVSHQYGFGLIDASLAVQNALAYNTSKEEIALLFKIISNQEMHANYVIDSTIGVDLSISIHHIEVEITMKHKNRGSLKIELVSPYGTISTLANSRTDNVEDYNEWLFTSLIHWGEYTYGNWTLKITDVHRLDVQSILTSWKLNFYGIEIPENKTEIFGIRVKKGEIIENVIRINEARNTTEETRKNIIDEIPKNYWKVAFLILLMVFIILIVIFATTIYLLSKKNTSDPETPALIDSEVEEHNQILGKQFLQGLEELRKKF